MGPLSDENKLHVDEKKNKTGKFEKILETNNIKNIKTFRYKLTALRNIILRSWIRRLWDLSSFNDYKKFNKKQ